MSDPQSSAAVLDRPQEAREMRRVPLSSIVLREGHNPRAQVVRDEDFKSLVATVREHGILQPLRVTERGSHEFELVAGERRYWAAVEAACIDVPVIIRAAGEGDEADLLVEALIENDLRVDLNPIERARAYQRLREGGLTLKGVAERLGRKTAHVRETIALLDLPDPLQELLVEGDLPRYAAPALLVLGRMHPQLAELAAEVVSSDEFDYDWSDVRDDPVAVVCAATELPDGVYRFNNSYPAESFSLTAKAQRALKDILRLTGRQQLLVRFTEQDAETAAALKALLASPRTPWAKLLVGADVASQIVCDALCKWATAARREDRERRQRQREQAQQAPAEVGADPTPAEPDSKAPAENETEAAAEREAAERERAEKLRAEREREQAERAAAVAYNDQLGAEVISKLSVVKVDARIMKILAAVPIAHAMPAIAARGAAYGFPGWPIVSQSDDGESVRSYLGREAAVAKADEYLAGAKKPGEIAGRMFALLVMAIFADDRCVPINLRSNYMPLVQGGPWRNEVGELIDQLVAEHLPLTLVQPKLDERKAARAAAAEQVAAQQLVRAALARLDELDGEDLDEIEEALPRAWSDAWHPERRRAAAAISRRRTTLAEQAQSTDADDTGADQGHEEQEEPVAAAA